MLAIEGKHDLATRATDAPAVGPPEFSSIYTSTALTSIIACFTPMLALLFLAGLSWTFRYSLRNPRPINKASGYRLQRYAPLFYIFLVLMSMVEMALASWLLLQYDYQHNFPNDRALAGTRLLLFTACWTTATAGIYSFLFIHPTWSRYPVSSVGSQVIWLFSTWILWIIGSAIMNAAIPSLFVKGSCTSIVYCGQIRSLFATAVMESLTFTLGMLMVIWLAWQSARDVLHSPDIPMK